MYARWRDEVDFYAVYIREAHPADGWSMESNDRVGIKIAQPKSTEERKQVAVDCCASLQMSMPLLVDSIDDYVGRAYSGFPDRLYLIDRAGKVAYKGGRGPFGYKTRELEQTMLMMFLDEARSKPAVSSDDK
jgi:Iodothyronine deiodinase